MPNVIYFKKLNENAHEPTKKTEGAAAFDLYASQNVDLKARQVTMVPTGIAVQIPEGYFGYIRPRSGISVQEKVILCSSGVIDSDYRGEVVVPFYNAKDQGSSIYVNQRIAQLLILPVPEFKFTEVTELGDTERGKGGFGSTGR